jgi:hypothetical protein
MTAELRVGSFGSLRLAKKVCALSAVSALSPPVDCFGSPRHVKKVCALSAVSPRADECCGTKLSRLPTIKRTHSAYPCFLRDIRSLCDPREAMQCRAEVMTCSRRHKDSEPGLSVSWLRRHGTSVRCKAGQDRYGEYGPGIGIVTATVARFSGRVQKRGGFLLHFRPALYLRTVTRDGGTCSVPPNFCPPFLAAGVFGHSCSIKYAGDWELL